MSQVITMCGAFSQSIGRLGIHSVDMVARWHRFHFPLVRAYIISQDHVRMCVNYPLVHQSYTVISLRAKDLALRSSKYRCSYSLCGLRVCPLAFPGKICRVWVGSQRYLECHTGICIYSWGPGLGIEGFRFAQWRNGWMD